MISFVNMHANRMEMACALCECVYGFCRIESGDSTEYMANGIRNFNKTTRERESKKSGPNRINTTNVQFPYLFEQV